MKETTHRLIETFFKEHPEMSYLFDRACLAVEKMAGVYLPNKIMTCGNGGSFSDSGHIVGELMKSFLKKRPVALSDGDETVYGKLEGAVPALCLGESSPLATAVLNDIGGEWIFAQQVYGLGCAGDVLIGLSTSGNSAGVLRAVRVAKRKGVFTVAMTGQRMRPAFKRARCGNLPRAGTASASVSSALRRRGIGALGLNKLHHKRFVFAERFFL